MKLRRLSRVRIAIKTEGPLSDNIKFEPESQQERSTPSEWHKFQPEDSISLNIKQEDAKNDTLNKIKLKQQAVDADDTNELDDAQIKQEDALKNDCLADIKRSSDRDYYYYQCCLCKLQFDSYPSVMDHRESVHDKRVKLSRIKHAHLEPDRNDPNYFCQSCEKTYASGKNYRKHLTVAHHIFFERKRIRPSSDEVPDPHDPNHHCRSCKSTYGCQTTYRKHLKHIHNIRVQPKPSIIKNPDILPDWNDSSYYCPSCERQYKTRKHFTKHCRHMHKMKMEKDQRSNTKEDLRVLHDPKFHCKICNITHKTENQHRTHCFEVHGMRMTISDTSTKTSNPHNQCSICSRVFSSTFSLNMHLFVIHKMDSDSAPPANSLLKPDINDPNNYCRACDKSYSSKQAFKYHLLSVHSISEKAQKKDEPKPDIDDPNNYCRICKRTYKSKDNYRSHLLHTHQMVMKRAYAYCSKQLPDPLDSNWYCRACERYYKSGADYRRHCKSVHRMELAPVSRVNIKPDAEIDINDPNLYCARCDRKYKTREQFLRHLREFHKVKLPPKTNLNLGATIDPNDPKWYCAKCVRHYSTSSSFRGHLKQIHKMIVAVQHK